MKYFKTCILLFFILLPAVLHGADVQEFILSNGLKVLIIEEHKAPVATFQVWYRAGGRNEPFGKSGMSHLLEHMMFKGTSRYGPSELSRIVQRNGGTNNAYTTKDYTVYFEIFAADRITLAVELEADRMRNLLLDDRELDSEKKVVMEERRLRYEDDPQTSLFEEVVAMAFKVHPYQRPVIGWMCDIESIRRDDLLNYYRTYYAPQNAVIIVVGDVDGKEMIKKIRENFEGIPSGEPVQQATSREPGQRGERRLFLEREAEIPYLIAAYHVPSFPHEDSYALDILALILSGGKSSRLYQSLVYEKKIALSADAMYGGFNRDPYLFFLFADASPGSNISDVENAISQNLEQLKKAPPSEREIRKAKNQIEASFLMGQDSIHIQAMQYGRFEMLGDWRFMDRYLEGIRKVTPADIVRVAQQYLTESNRTTGILMPVREVKSEKSAW